jgi:uncharacterized repeat protein (TIGR02543 family)
MRNHKIIALALSATLLSGLLIGCNQSNNSANSASSGQITGTTYKVTFNAGDGKFADGTSSKVVETASGATVTLPDNPTKEGYAFDAWYKDDAYKVLFDVATAITADWTLYAGYKVADVSSSADTSSDTSTSTSQGTSSSSGSQTGNVYYLDATDVSWWADASALVKAHYWYPEGQGTGTTWPGVSMVLVKDLVYSITVTGSPSGFVFVRQDPATASAATPTIWNQTVDATPETGKNCFKLSTSQDTQKHQQGSWTTYTA